MKSTYPFSMRHGASTNARNQNGIDRQNPSTDLRMMNNGSMFTVYWLAVCVCGHRARKMAMQIIALTEINRVEKSFHIWFALLSTNITSICLEMRRSTHTERRAHIHSHWTWLHAAPHSTECGDSFDVHAAHWTWKRSCSHAHTLFTMDIGHTPYGLVWGDRRRVRWATLRWPHEIRPQTLCVATVKSVLSTVFAQQNEWQIACHAKWKTKKMKFRNVRNDT